MRQETVKLIFIDGPLEGTTKFVSKEELLNTRTYKVYVPITSTAVKNYDMKETEARIVCTEAIYIAFNMPPSYGMERYVMSQQNAGLGN